MRKRPRKTEAYDELLQSVREIAGAGQRLNCDAFRAYAPVVESIVREGGRDAKLIEHTLDGLLDFCGHPPVLDLYKKLCRHYWTIDQTATAHYINAYREIWESEGTGRNEANEEE